MAYGGESSSNKRCAQRRNQPADNRRIVIWRMKAKMKLAKEKKWQRKLMKAK